MKPRSDATLKTLSPDRQRQIIAWLKTGSQAKTIKLIREQFGVRTSSAALSRFFAWWHVTNPLHEIGLFIREYDEHQTDSNPLPAQIDKLLNLALGSMARQVNLNPDPGLLTTLVRLRLDLRKAEREDLKLAEALKLTRWKVDNENADRQLVGKYRAEADREMNQMKKQFKQDLRAQTQLPKPNGSSPCSSSTTPHSARRTQPPSSPRDPDFSDALSAANLAASASDTDTPTSESPISSSSSSSVPPSASVDDAIKGSQGASDQDDLATRHSTPATRPSTPSDIPHSELRTPNSEVPHSEAPPSASVGDTIKASQRTEEKSDQDPLATCHLPPATGPATPAPRLPFTSAPPAPRPRTNTPYPTLDTAPFPKLLDQAHECLDRIAHGLHIRDYRPNYQHVSNQLLTHLGAIRSLICPPLIASRYTAAPPLPNSPDFELLLSLIDQAGHLAGSLDATIRGSDTRPSLSALLEPLVPQIRGPLYQLAQHLGLPTPPCPNP